MCGVCVQAAEAGACVCMCVCVCLHVGFSGVRVIVSLTNTEALLRSCDVSLLGKVHVTEDNYVTLSDSF